MNLTAFFFPPFKPNEIIAPEPFGINLQATLYPLCDFKLGCLTQLTSSFPIKKKQYIQHWKHASSYVGQEFQLLTLYKTHFVRQSCPKSLKPSALALLKNAQVQTLDKN